VPLIVALIVVPFIDSPHAIGVALQIRSFAGGVIISYKNIIG
jgi:hypothetical protein